MSSYKPVIYVFSILGALAVVGLGFTAVQGLRTLSQMDGDFSNDYMMNDEDFLLNMDGSATGSSAYPRYSDVRGEDPSASEIDDRTDDGSYLGKSVLYTTMQDSTIMMELKMPDEMDITLRSILQRPDTSLQELYQSDTKLALRMTALNGDMQTILVQDLANGDIYDTKIDARANFGFVGPQIVHLIASTSRPDELIQVLVHNLETNQTTRGTALGEGFSYTKKVSATGPIAQMAVKNGKIEVQVYPTTTPARFDTDRTAVRVETYPSGS